MGHSVNNTAVGRHEGDPAVRVTGRFMVIDDIDGGLSMKVWRPS